MTLDWAAIQDELDKVLSPAEKVDAFVERLLPQQHSFLADPSKRKVALCSRRAGKTYAALAYFMRACVTTPRAKCIYVALTYGSAKEIAWADLKQLSRDIGLDLRFNEVELKATFTNGASIKLVGADKTADIERLRGQRFAVVALDECGSFGPHIRPLVEEVLAPALMDLQGDLLLLGTPSAKHAGLFFEASTGGIPGWSVHRWTFRENVFLKGAEEWLAGEMEQRGLTTDSPIYLREYCGQWARGSDRLVFSFDEVRNTYDELPALTDFYASIDFGFIDPTAFVVVGYNKTDPVLYVLEAFQRDRMLTDDIASEMRRLSASYPIRRWIGDAGGYGKSPIEEIRKHYSVAIHPAEKTDKAGSFALINNDLRTGKIKVPRGSQLADKWLNWLIRDDGAPDPDADDHEPMAFAYVYRYCQHFRSAPPPVFVPATLAQKEQAMFDAVRRQVYKEHNPNEDEPFRFEDL